MLVFAWFWAISSAFSPVNLVLMSAQALEAQCAAVEAVTSELMSLGWVDEDDAPIL